MGEPQDSCRCALRRDAAQEMRLPAEVTPGRHLSAFLIFLKPRVACFSAAQEVFQSAASRSTKAPCCFDRRRTCEETGCGETSANFLSFRASLHQQFFSSVRVLPISLGHPLEKCWAPAISINFRASCRYSTLLCGDSWTSVGTVGT